MCRRAFFGLAAALPIALREQGPRFSSGPRSTWEYVQDQGKAPEIPRGAVFSVTATCSRGMGIPWNPVGLGMGITAAWFAVGIWTLSACTGSTMFRSCYPPARNGRGGV